MAPEQGDVPHLHGRVALPGHHPVDRTLDQQNAFLVRHIQE